MNKENTAPTASVRVGCKRKAGARDRDTSCPSKKKREGTRKTVVRRALNKSTKQSVLAVLKKACSLDPADSGGELGSGLGTFST